MYTRARLLNAIKLALGYLLVLDIIRVFNRKGLRQTFSMLVLPPAPTLIKEPHCVGLSGERPYLSQHVSQRTFSEYLAP